MFEETNVKKKYTEDHAKYFTLEEIDAIQGREKEPKKKNLIRLLR